MKKMIPDNAFYTAEVRLNGTTVPGYSSWQGEIDIASLFCAENPDLPFHVSSVQALLDDVEGLGVTIQAKSHLVEPKPRHNIIQRVWLVITNHTADPITFENKRLMFFGRGAAAGFTLPRQAIPALEPTTDTPFEVLDLDGAILDTAFVSATNEGAGSGDMVKAVYDTNNNGKVNTAENAEALGSHDSAYHLARANHSGTQAIGTIVGLQTYLAITAARTLDHTDAIVGADATSGGLTVTLPTAVGIEGKIYGIIKTDSGTNAITIATTSSQTVDGFTTNKKLFYQNDLLLVVSDGANWKVLDFRISGPVPLTYSSTLTIDCALIPPGGKAQVTLTGACTLAAFTNYKKGQAFILIVRQDATGSRTMAYTTGSSGGQRFNTTVPSPTLTTTASKHDKLGWLHDATDDRFDLVAIVQGV